MVENYLENFERADELIEVRHDIFSKGKRKGKEKIAREEKTSGEIQVR